MQIHNHLSAIWKLYYKYSYLFLILLCTYLSFTCHTHERVLFIWWLFCVFKNVRILETHVKIVNLYFVKKQSNAQVLKVCDSSHETAVKFNYKLILYFTFYGASFRLFYGTLFIWSLGRRRCAIVKFLLKRGAHSVVLSNGKVEP